MLHGRPSIWFAFRAGRAPADRIACPLDSSEADALPSCGRQNPDRDLRIDRIERADGEHSQGPFASETQPLEQRATDFLRNPLLSSLSNPIDLLESRQRVRHDEPPAVHLPKILQPIADFWSTQ